MSDGYISLTAYANMHGLNRVKLRNNVEQGLYESARKKNKRWLIHKDEVVKESIVASVALDKEDYIPVFDYAQIHGVKRKGVLVDIKAGYYETAKLINSRWYIHKEEPCKTLTDDYITLTAYAKLHNVSRVKLIDDVNKGVYTTVIQKGAHTYIKKDEEFKSFDRRKFSQMPEYISVKEYAALNGFSYQKMMNDVKKGLYYTAYCKNTRWYIDKNESCKSTDKRKERGNKTKPETAFAEESTLISVADYAKSNDLPYQKVLKDVKDGLYETAVQKKSRWFLDKNESLKSKYKRSKVV